MNNKVTILKILGIIVILAVLVGFFIYWRYPGMFGGGRSGEDLPIERVDGKYCVDDDDCTIFGETGDCNCGCFNQNYPWYSMGDCFCLAPDSCKCVEGACEDVFEELTSWKSYYDEDRKFEVGFPGDWEITTIPDPDSKSYVKSLFVVVIEKPIENYTCRFEVEVVDTENSLIQEEVDLMTSLSYEISFADTDDYSITRLTHVDADSCATYFIRKETGDYFRIDHYVIDEFVDSENVTVFFGDVPECSEAFYQMLFTFRSWD